MTLDKKKSANGLDLEALQGAVELCDAQTMFGFYAEDAEVQILNGDAPHSVPFELRGSAEISRYLRALSNQEMTCQVESGVVSSEERITFSARCHYPDGTRVVVKTTLELNSEGEIVRQVDVVSQEAKEAAGEEGGARGKRNEEE